VKKPHLSVNTCWSGEPKFFWTGDQKKEHLKVPAKGRLSFGLSGGKKETKKHHLLGCFNRGQADPAEPEEGKQ